MAEILGIRNPYGIHPYVRICIYNTYTYMHIIYNINSDFKESREVKDFKDSKEVKDSKESKKAKELKDVKESSSWY